MRALLVAPTLLLIAFAGCLGGDEATPAEKKETLPETPAAPPLPAAIKDTKAVEVGVDPSYMVNDGPCSLSGVSTCYKYEFTVEKANETTNATKADADVDGEKAKNTEKEVQKVRVTASLTWSLPVNDFDLFLMQGSRVVEKSLQGVPTTQEDIVKELEPGKYTLIVSVYAVVHDAYTIDAKFDLTNPEKAEGSGKA